MKNLAIAFNMYFTDYDRMPPEESRAEIVNFYADGGDAPSGGGCDSAKTAQNPYLRFPVVLDDYVKNRQVWRCPSAKAEYNPGIIPIVNGDFWPTTRDTYLNNDCTKYLQCSRPFPPGWGGTVTDSFLQQACSDPSSGGVSISLYGLEQNYGLNLGSVNDSARWLTVCEVGAGLDSWATFNLAFPEVCHAGCATTNPTPLGDGDCLSSQAQWENPDCSWVVDCSPDPKKFGTDATYRKTLTRHLGGSNLGFMDGHARWYPAEAILTGGPDWRPMRRTSRAPSCSSKGRSGSATCRISSARHTHRRSARRGAFRAPRSFWPASDGGGLVPLEGQAWYHSQAGKGGMASCPGSGCRA